jgi:hypothetical protein
MRYKKYGEYKKVAVGDLVMDTSVSSRPLEVAIVNSKNVVVVLKGQDETTHEEKAFQFCLQKKRLAFWDLEKQNKLEYLYNKRGDLSERIWDLDKVIKNIEESYIGCE